MELDVSPAQDWKRQIYATFVRLGTRRRYSRGEALFVQGEPPRAAFALESGRVVVGRVTPGGREIIHFIHHAGAIFGFAEILLDRERHRSAHAVEEAVLWVVPRAVFLNLLRQQPEVTYRLLMLVSERLLATQAIVEELVAESVAERVLHLLVRLGRELGWGNPAIPAPIPIRLTHEEIAQVVGSTRQTVTTILNDLEAQGLIQVRPRAISITDWDRLQRVAGLHPLGRG